MFRDARYEIVVERAGAGDAVSLVVDGTPVEGDVVPLAAAGGSVLVEVMVGG